MPADHNHLHVGEHLSVTIAFAIRPSSSVILSFDVAKDILKKGSKEKPEPSTTTTPAFIKKSHKSSDELLSFSS